GLYHLGPAPGFFADESGRGSRGVAARLGRERRVTRDHLGLGKRGRHVAADALGKRGRRFGRRGDREPGGGDGGGEGLRGRRHLCEGGQALRTGDGENLERAAGNQPVRAAEIVEAKVDVAGEEAVERRHRATVWHVHRLDAGHRFEQLRGEVRGGADA